MELKGVSCELQHNGRLVQRLSVETGFGEKSNTSAT